MISSDDNNAGPVSRIHQVKERSVVVPKLGDYEEGNSGDDFAIEKSATFVPTNGHDDEVTAFNPSLPRLREREPPAVELISRLDRNANGPTLNPVATGPQLPSTGVTPNAKGEPSEWVSGLGVADSEDEEVVQRGSPLFGAASTPLVQSNDSSTDTPSNRRALRGSPKSSPVVSQVLLSPTSDQMPTPPLLCQFWQKDDCVMPLLRAVNMVNMAPISRKRKPSETTDSEEPKRQRCTAEPSGKSKKQSRQRRHKASTGNGNDESSDSDSELSISTEKNAKKRHRYNNRRPQRRTPAGKRHQCQSSGTKTSESSLPDSDDDALLDGRYADRLSFNTRKQLRRESVSEYVRALKILVWTAYGDQDVSSKNLLVKGVFMWGLKVPIRAEVFKRRPFVTLKEVVAAAKECERRHENNRKPDFRLNGDPLTDQSHSSSVTNAAGEDLHPSGSSRRDNLTVEIRFTGNGDRVRMVGNPVSLSGRSQGQPVFSGLCWNCAASGHRSSSCLRSPGYLWSEAKSSAK